MVKGGGAQIDDDTHIPTNEGSAGGIEEVHDAVPVRIAQHNMTGRGMPYFEEIIENSRLGRIRRQKGGHTSADGSSKVQWEVVEVGGDDEEMAELASDVSSGNANKRMRMDI